MVINSDLYEIVKQAIPDQFHTRYETDRATANETGAAKIIPNVVVIHIMPAEKPVRDISGRILRNYRRVEFLVYTDRGKMPQAARVGEMACEEIKQFMNSIHNSKFDISDGENTRTIKIISSQILIDTNYLGMTEQGIHRYSLEYKLIYS